MSLCKFKQLNPFLGDAYLIKFKGSPAQNITSKEAYFKRAESHKNYEGYEAGLIIQRNNEIVEIEGSFCLDSDVVLGAWAKVYRNDRKVPALVKVKFSRYNKGHSTWKQIPEDMIRKVALVQALREAFPENLSGLFTQDEIPEPLKADANAEKFNPEKEIKAEAKIEEAPEDKFYQTPTADDFDEL
jgi:phage recombination protein Bet